MLGSHLYDHTSAASSVSARSIGVGASENELSCQSRGSEAYASTIALAPSRATSGSSARYLTVTKALPAQLERPSALKFLSIKAALTLRDGSVLQ